MSGGRQRRSGFSTLVGDVKKSAAVTNRRSFSEDLDLELVKFSFCRIESIGIGFISNKIIALIVPEPF